MNYLVGCFKLILRQPFFVEENLKVFHNVELLIVKYGFKNEIKVNLNICLKFVLMKDNIMLQFKFDKEKSTTVLSYITQNLEKTDFLRVFKVLYFAEQKHLARFGRPIVGDNYLAMKHGPVPYNIYNELGKIENGIGKMMDNLMKNNISFSDFFEVKKNKDGKSVFSKINPDFDAISQSELTCLDESLEENKRLSFNQLSNKSHDYAWKKANANDEMDILDIAQSGGASSDMLNYISIMAENQDFTFA